MAGQSSLRAPRDRRGPPVWYARTAAKRLSFSDAERCKVCPNRLWRPPDVFSIGTRRPLRYPPPDLRTACRLSFVLANAALLHAADSAKGYCTHSVFVVLVRFRVWFRSVRVVFLRAESPSHCSGPYVYAALHFYRLNGGRKSRKRSSFASHRRPAVTTQNTRLTFRTWPTWSWRRTFGRTMSSAISRETKHCKNERIPPRGGAQFVCLASPVSFDLAPKLILRCGDRWEIRFTERSERTAIRSLTGDIKRVIVFANRCDYAMAR